jgi:hypothetical protein
MTRPEPLSGAVEPLARGLRVLLRPVHGNDYPYLYALVSEGSLGARSLFHGVTPSPDQFHTVLWQKVVVQFIVADQATGERLGLARCLAPDLAGTTASAELLVADDDLGRGVLVEGLTVFVGYLFRTKNYRKIYFRLPEYFRHLVESGDNRYFSTEACFQERYFFDEQYWDVDTISVSRESWELHAPRFEAALSRATGAARDSRILGFEMFRARLAAETRPALATADRDLRLLDDLKLDSLDLFEIAVVIAELGVVVGYEEIATATIGDLYRRYATARAVP